MAAVARLMPFEHPFANRQQNASKLATDRKRIENSRDGSAYGSRTQFEGFAALRNSATNMR
jgi:hypothetical protein